eukprot:363755-Chlamydomonas_euryale.AAC.5
MLYGSLAPGIASAVSDRRGLQIVGATVVSSTLGTSIMHTCPGAPNRMGTILTVSPACSRLNVLCTQLRFSSKWGSQPSTVFQLRAEFASPQLAATSTALFIRS